MAFSAVGGGMVTITITLNEGWRLKAGIEAVKIQGYTSAPSGNPSPGHLRLIKGNRFQSWYLKELSMVSIWMLNGKQKNK